MSPEQQRAAEDCARANCSRRGPRFRTYTKRHWHPLDPDPALLHPVDIARSLSLQVRFGGHLEFPYNVAHHSVLVAEEVWSRENARTPKHASLARAALLHEVAEAYSGFGDVTTVKLDPAVRAVVKPTEHAIDAAAGERFGLPLGFADDPEIKAADRLVFLAEDRDLREIVWDYAPEVPHEKVEPWAPLDAEWRWLRWFQLLFPDDRDMPDVIAHMQKIRRRVSWLFANDLDWPFAPGDAPAIARGR